MADEAVSAAVESSPVASQVTESAPAQAAAPAEVVFDSGYVSRAQSALGLNETDLRTLPRDQVERMLAYSDRQLISRGQQEFSASQPQAEPQRAAAPPAHKPGAFAFDPFDLKFDPEVEADGPIPKSLKAMDGHYRAQMQKMHEFYEQRFHQFEEFRDSQLIQQEYALMDRFVEQAGPQWAEILGKGSTARLNPQSREFLNREDVRRAAIVMVRQRGISPDEALPRALNALFTEKAFALERAKADEKKKQLAIGATDRTRPPANAGTPMSIADRVKSMRELARSA